MEGDNMSAGGGGLIQMILSRAIGRHLSSAAPAWPSDRYFHPLPWCCYRVVTELCAVFVHFCVILTPSALTLWRLLTPSHFHSPSEHSCYKNIAMFTLSSPLLSSPRGHVSPDTELNIIMRPPTTRWGPVSANQSSGWRPLTNERSGIPSLVFRQWWVRGRHVWRAESCVWIWGEMCEGPWLPGHSWAPVQARGSN